jgi:UDP-GlcNAc:undecaprenyl-phosphate/decaprenyl-phosphate GlcNAc-1-phosphate transferase
MPELESYLIVAAVVIVVTAALTPVVRRVAVRVGAVVKPDERRVHDRPTPTLGGVAMFGGLLAGMLVAWRMDAFHEVFSDTTEPLGVVLSASVMIVVGVIDDLREVSAPAKMAGIVVSASVLVLSGISLVVLRIPFQGTFLLSSDWSYLISVIWVVALANAINLIDGLDGLAAGIVAIASGTFFVYSMQLGDAGVLQPGNIGPLLAIVVAGMCLGFLPHNFHPAKIFMGDGGALLLGLMMAASTMVVGGQNDQPYSGQSFFFFAPMLIPLLILGVPVLDTVLAILRRASRRTGVATADKEHLHHRLMRLGHGHRRSVLILWAWTALLSLFVLYPTITGAGNGIVPIGLLAIFLVLYTVLHPSVKSVRREPAPATAEGSDVPGSDVPVESAAASRAVEVDPDSPARQDSGRDSSQGAS